MAPNQPARLQKRSRASDVAERSSRSGEERSKRRRTSNAHESENLKVAELSGSTDAANATEIVDGSLQATDQSKNPASWSFSSPVGGRYSNLDPILTDDEALVLFSYFDYVS